VTAGPSGPASDLDPLRAAGHEVVIVSKSGRTPGAPGVRAVAADATDAAALRDIARGAAVVYNCANPPHYHRWATEWPPLAEAILGFLGVGVPPYVPSWGNVIASGKNVIREAFWVSLFPGVALTLAGLSLNLLGDGLRDLLDPRLRVQ